MIPMTEQRNPRSEGIDGRSIEEILSIMNSEDLDVVSAVRNEIPSMAEAVRIIADAIGGGRRVFFVGAGTSGRLGVIEAAEMAPTFSVSTDLFTGVIAGGLEAMSSSVEGAEDDETAGGEAVRAQAFGTDDVLVALSASGNTPFVIGALRQACESHGRTIAVTCNPDSQASVLSGVCIVPRVGPELVAGSTRLKSATAQKLVLNMLTTASMMRLGYVYDGYMVGVKPSNRKLRGRVVRIVSEIAHVSEKEAVALLEQTGWDAKIAIVLAKTGRGLDEAGRLLEKAQGNLRRALELGRAE